MSITTGCLSVGGNSIFGGGGGSLPVSDCFAAGADAAGGAAPEVAPCEGTGNVAGASAGIAGLNGAGRDEWSMASKTRWSVLNTCR
jgi:hypothetical protein